LVCQYRSDTCNREHTVGLDSNVVATIWYSILERWPPNFSLSPLANVVPDIGEAIVEGQACAVARCLVGSVVIEAERRDQGSGQKGIEADTRRVGSDLRAERSNTGTSIHRKD